MDTTDWEVRYVYGQYRTAESVAHRLRQNGQKAWAKTLPDGNHVVLVPPSRKQRPVDKPTTYGAAKMYEVKQMPGGHLAIVRVGEDCPVTLTGNTRRELYHALRQMMDALFSPPQIKHLEQECSPTNRPTTREDES